MTASGAMVNYRMLVADHRSSILCAMRVRQSGVSYMWFHIAEEMNSLAEGQIFRVQGWTALQR